MSVLTQLDEALTDFLYPPLTFHFDPLPDPGHTHTPAYTITFLDHVLTNAANYIPVRQYSGTKNSDPLVMIMQSILSHSMSPSGSIPPDALGLLHTYLQDELVRPVHGALFCYSLLNVLAPMYDVQSITRKIDRGVVTAMALKQEILEFSQIVLNSCGPEPRMSMYSMMPIHELQAHATDLFSAAIMHASAQTGFDPARFFQSDVSLQ